MTDHFSFSEKKRSVFSKTRLPLQASSSIRHVTRHYSCSDGQKCPASEHCHTWYLMLHLQIFFLSLETPTLEEIYILCFRNDYQFLQAPPLVLLFSLIFLLYYGCAFHCGYFQTLSVYLKIVFYCKLHSIFFFFNLVF